MAKGRRRRGGAPGPGETAGERDPAGEAVPSDRDAAEPTEPAEPAEPARDDGGDDAADDLDLDAPEPDLAILPAPAPDLGDDELLDDPGAPSALALDVPVDGDDEEGAAVIEAPRRRRARPAGDDAGAARRDLVRYDPLTAYVQEIRRTPLLTREEEHDLAARYAETGDPALARRLVTANLRLVVKIAHEYRRAYRNLLDLVQEGNVGLMQAVKKYDPFRGVKLSSYAAWWIRAYILKFILNNWRLVKIGTTQAQRKLFFNLRKEKEKLERLGFAPEHRLLAERLEVTVEEVAEMEQRLEGSDVSLDAPVSKDDDGGRTRMDVLPSGGGVRPDVRAENEEFRRLLREKLEEFGRTLEGRDLVLFRERWLTETPLTLQEIGERFGISRERARQIEKRMLGKLRVHLEEALGGAVDIGAVGPEE